MYDQVKVSVNVKWTPQVTKLRDILATLYPTIQDSQRVIQEAGYALQNFAFSNKALENWHNLLNEALKDDHMVDDLLAVAIRHYGRNRELMAAYTAYSQRHEADSTQTTSGEQQASTSRTQHPAINTGGGAYIAGNVSVGGNFVGRDQTSTGNNSANNSPSTKRKVKLLFLTANPVDTPLLKLDEEVRAVDQALRKTSYRDHFDFIQHRAVQYGDLQDLLLHHEPDLVHFSGHGSETGELLLQDEKGIAHPIREQTLSRLFAVLKDNIRCVVLNACYSEQQAAAIAQHIDVVIGMKHGLGDIAARNFAAAFYQGLGYGRSVQTAFDLGCLQIDLANLDEKDAPQLKTRHAAAAQFVFVTK